MLAGFLVQKRQKLDIAEKLTDEILAVEPANIDVMFIKVTVLQLNKHYTEAYALNEKILSLNKGYEPSIDIKHQILANNKSAIPASGTFRKTGYSASLPTARRLMGDFSAVEIAGQKTGKSEG